MTASLISLLDRCNSAALWKATIRVWGNRVRATSADRLLYLFLNRFGAMGTHEASLFRSLVKPGHRVLDIGANIGLFSLLLARLTGPTGEVHAFEPEPRLYETLVGNVRLNAMDWIACYNSAVGDCAGKIRLFRSFCNSGDNRVGDSAWDKQAVDVPINRVDDLVPHRSYDFIKMDVQGFEAKVLQGMTQVLANSAGLRIFLEFWPYGLRRANSEPVDLLRSLVSTGFQLYQLDGRGLRQIGDLAGFVAELQGKSYTNVLASRV